MSDSAQFTVLEHKLPERIGLPLAEIVMRRRDLIAGTDWLRQGRWIKYSESGVAKLMQQTGVEELNPPAPDPTRRTVEVHRMNFPNLRVIECREFETGTLHHVKIKPEWRPMYRPKMKIDIWLGKEALATTRRPKGVYRF